MAFVSSADQRATAESGVVVQMEILYIAVLRTSHAAAQFVPPFFNFSSLSCFLNPSHCFLLSLRPLFLLHFHPVRSLVSPLRRPFCRSALLFAYSLTLYVFLYSSSFHTCLLRCSVHIPSSSSSSITLASSMSPPRAPCPPHSLSFSTVSYLMPTPLRPQVRPMYPCLLLP